MNKSSYFFGQSVFGQLISLIDSNLVKRVVKKHNSDYYTKKFTTSDHLISMLFSTFTHCSSLREVAGGMLGLKWKVNHFQLKNIPYKSTLSDANARRSHFVFQDLYYSLLEEHRSFLSDSRERYVWENKLEIIDSSTISLFKDSLQCVGRKSVSGKQDPSKVHFIIPSNNNACRDCFRPLNKPSDLMNSKINSDSINIKFLCRVEKSAASRRFHINLLKNDIPNLAKDDNIFFDAYTDAYVYNQLAKTGVFGNYKISQTPAAILYDPKKGITVFQYAILYGYLKNSEFLSLDGLLNYLRSQWKSSS